MPRNPPTQIERIARAMSDEDDDALLLSGIGPIPWDQLSAHDRSDYLRYAAIAVRIMAEDQRA